MPITSMIVDDWRYCVKTFSIEPIGVIRSEIKHRDDAPLFYTEGAPNAFLEMIPAYMDGLDRCGSVTKSLSSRGCTALAGKC